MPDWLTSSFDDSAELPLAALVVRQVAALVLGCVVAGVYKLTHGRAGNGSIGLTATLVLLTVLIAAVTMVIGNSVARAFSLVGALAIVRFRTVVEDTRDTAFVIFAVAVGMAVGAGHLAVPLVLIPVAGLAAYIFGPRDGAAEGAWGWGAGGGEHLLTVRLGPGDATDSVRAMIAQHGAGLRMAGIATARQGAAVDHTFAIRLKTPDDAAVLVRGLSGVAGVQSVELRGA